MSTDEKFNITQIHRDGIETIYLRGYLDAHTAPVLEKAINGAMVEGKYRILVNFRDLDYISSAGLGVFMAFIEEIREKGGDIKMAGMKQKVFSVFDLLGFPLLFDIDNEEVTALRKFTSGHN